MIKVALCQCISCKRYLSRNRNPDGTDPQICTGCRAKESINWDHGPGLPLAKIRGTLTDPLSLECLALLSEECSEVIQRNGKIGRWGWEASFDGTTQQHKLELELGDVLAAIALAIYNKQVAAAGVIAAYKTKIAAFIEDSEGPRQRLLHAEVPNAAHGMIVLMNEMLAQTDSGGRMYLHENIGGEYCRGCGCDQPGYRRCQCQNDE